MNLNYTSLQTEVANYLNRTNLTSQIPTFIGLAEAYLFREVRIKDIEVSVSGTTASGYATLPADFGTLSKVSVTSNGSTYNLDYQSDPSTPTAVDPSPSYYSFENGKIRIWGAGTGQAYTLFYVPAIAALSASNLTNWLITNASDLYLYASCLEGARYIRDAAEITRLSALVATALDSVQRFIERRGQPTTGSMQIRRRG